MYSHSKSDTAGPVYHYLQNLYLDETLQLSTFILLIYCTAANLDKSHIFSHNQFPIKKFHSCCKNVNLFVVMKKRLALLLMLNSNGN